MWDFLGAIENIVVPKVGERDETVSKHLIVIMHISVHLTRVTLMESDFNRTLMVFPYVLYHYMFYVGFNKDRIHSIE